MTEKCPTCGGAAVFNKDHYECQSPECPCQAFEVWEAVFECNKCCPGCTRSVKYPSQSSAILLNSRNALEGCGMVNPRSEKDGGDCAEWHKVAIRKVEPQSREQTGYCGFCGSWKNAEDIVNEYKFLIKARKDIPEAFCNLMLFVVLDTKIHMLEWLDGDLASYRAIWEKEIERR